MTNFDFSQYFHIQPVSVQLVPDAEQPYGIPEGWIWVTLGSIGEYYNGRAFKQNEWTNVGRPIIRIQDLTGTNTNPNYYNGPVDQRHEVKAGDLLISWSATLGAFIWNGPSAVLNQHIFKVKSSIDKMYHYYLVLHFINELYQKTHGSGMVHITKGIFNATPVPLPPLTEQKKIVARIESLIGKIKLAKSHVEHIPSTITQTINSLIHYAFSGKLTENFRSQYQNEIEPAETLLERIRNKRNSKWEESIRSKGRSNKKNICNQPEGIDTSNLPELPRGWCWVTLGELIEKIEAGKSPSAQGHPAASNEYGVLKVSAVSWGEFLPNENKALFPGYDVEGIPTVQEGDLLISRANTVELVGAVVRVKESYPNLILSDKTLRLVPILNDINIDYLLYALRTRYVRRLFEEATGTSDSMRNLSQDKILKAPIALAPLIEQNIIAENIKNEERLLKISANLSKDCLMNLEALVQQILNKAFHGELGQTKVKTFT
ncbi:restriction endonuclease subunit S [Brevibacillus brevis]|nr:restriction endonuclease subunit S [Brevibacillus brevis]